MRFKFLITEFYKIEAGFTNRSPEMYTVVQLAEASWVMTNKKSDRKKTLKEHDRSRHFQFLRQRI